jgi:hypothetical protein
MSAPIASFFAVNGSIICRSNSAVKKYGASTRSVGPTICWPTRPDVKNAATSEIEIDWLNDHGQVDE